LLANNERAAEVRRALDDHNPAAAFSGKDLAGLQYAERLTTSAAALQADDIQELRDAGFDDGEILELNQVTAYFGYANRTVLGLGIDTDGDIIGLSPGDSGDPANWSHE
jgi:alkylhydroperoxidase family enzyme